MRRSLAGRVAGLFASGCALMAAGCQLDRCYPGIDPHARYRVNVQEPYTPQSTFTYDDSLTRHLGLDTACTPGSDGIGAGAILELQDTGTTPDRQSVCSFVTTNLISAPAEITFSGPSTNMHAVNAAFAGDSLMVAAEDVTFGACAGAMALVVLPGKGPASLFATPVPGQLPPAVLFRYFFPTSGACAECDDDFVIQLTKE